MNSRAAGPRVVCPIWCTFLMSSLEEREEEHELPVWPSTSMDTHSSRTTSTIKAITSRIEKTIMVMGGGQNVMLLSYWPSVNITLLMYLNGERGKESEEQGETFCRRAIIYPFLLVVHSCVHAIGMRPSVIESLVQLQSRGISSKIPFNHALNWFSISIIG